MIIIYFMIFIYNIRSIVWSANHLMKNKYKTMLFTKTFTKQRFDKSSSVCFKNGLSWINIVKNNDDPIIDHHQGLQKIILGLLFDQ